MKEFNPFYDQVRQIVISEGFVHNAEATLYIKTGDRRKLNNIIAHYFGLVKKQPMHFNSLQEPVKLAFERQQNPTIIGTQTIVSPTGWCIVDVNNFKKLNEFGLYISKLLQATFIQTIYFPPSSYCYFLICKDGDIIREIENSNDSRKPHINTGKPLEFEKDYEYNCNYFDGDQLEDYVYHLGFDLHDCILGDYYTLLQKTST